MNPKSLFLSILLFSLPCCFIQGQKFFKNTELSFGYGVQPQDRRLYDYINQEVVLTNEDSKYDHQYSFLFSKYLIPGKHFTLSAGLGYSLFQTKFSRPFDQRYFGDFTKPLLHIGVYNKHLLLFNISPGYDFIKSGKSKFGVIFPLNLNFAFNKSVRLSTHTWQENKYLFDFDSFEIYSGFKYQYAKFSLSCSYRIYNFQEIDKLIFCYLLFRWPYPPTYYNKTEELNLNKFMITISYKLYRNYV